MCLSRAETPPKRLYRGLDVLEDRILRFDDGDGDDPDPENDRRVFLEVRVRWCIPALRDCLGERDVDCRMATLVVHRQRPGVLVRGRRGFWSREIALRPARAL